MMTRRSNTKTEQSLMAFFSGRRLPDQVFAQGPGNCVFLEFARAFSASAWQLFSDAALSSGDADVWCRCIDPDAEAYYASSFAQPAEFRFQARGGPDRYIARMHEWPTGSPADAVAYRGDAVAWASDSGSWACWGQRDSGLCVLRAVEGNHLQFLSGSVAETLPVMTLDEALRDVVANELPAERRAFFAERMRLCYS